VGLTLLFPLFQASLGGFNTVILSSLGLPGWVNTVIPLLWASLGGLTLLFPHICLPGWVNTVIPSYMPPWVGIPGW